MAWRCGRPIQPCAWWATTTSSSCTSAKPPCARNSKGSCPSCAPVVSSPASTTRPRPRFPSTTTASICVCSTNTPRSNRHLVSRVAPVSRPAVVRVSRPAHAPPSEEPAVVFLLLCNEPPRHHTNSQSAAPYARQQTYRPVLLLAPVSARVVLPAP